jgi:hypothetical protein
LSKTRVGHVAAAVAAAILLAGCGSQTTAAKPQGHPAHHAKTQKQKAPAPPASGSTGAAGAAGSSAASGTQAGSTGTAQNVPTLSYTLAPPSQTSGGAMAMLSVANVPQGWTLETLQAVSSAGVMASATPSQAMTSVFGQPQGGFSMGSDGEIISYFFPNPPGKWAHTTVHFAFIYTTSAGTSGSITSKSFAFPAG